MAWVSIRLFKQRADIAAADRNVRLEPYADA